MSDTTSHMFLVEPTVAFHRGCRKRRAGLLTFKMLIAFQEDGLGERARSDWLVSRSGPNYLAGLAQSNEPHLLPSPNLKGRRSPHLARGIVREAASSLSSSAC